MSRAAALDRGAPRRSGTPDRRDRCEPAAPPAPLAPLAPLAPISPRRPLAASIAPLALTVALVAAGAAGCADGGREAAGTYQARCARCHGSDGRGDSRSVGLYPRLDLTASPMVRAGARARGELFLRIADGYGAMPGFAGHLETSEMQDLADYVLRLPREKAGR